MYSGYFCALLISIYLTDKFYLTIISNFLVTIITTIINEREGRDQFRGSKKTEVWSRTEGESDSRGLSVITGNMRRYLREVMPARTRAKRDCLESNKCMYTRNGENGGREKIFRIN